MSSMSRAVTVLALAVLLNFATTYLPGYLRTLTSTPMATTPVKLFGFPTSTCTRRVAVVLKEKNVPYEFVTVDLTKGEQKNAEYLATKQPFGQVPVLQDGNFTIYESRAIARYIAMKYAHQGTELIPSFGNLEALAKFEEAASVEQNNFDPFASGIAYEKVFKVRRGGTTNEARVEELTATLKQKLEAYERILSKQKYLAGDDLTLVDLFHLPYGKMITDLGVEVLTSTVYPNVTRWWGDITSRESWQAVKDGAA